MNPTIQNWATETMDLLDKYLEKTYNRATTEERAEIRALQHRVKGAIDYYQTELIDNIPF